MCSIHTAGPGFCRRRWRWRSRAGFSRAKRQKHLDGFLCLSLNFEPHDRLRTQNAHLFAFLALVCPSPRRCLQPWCCRATEMLPGLFVRIRRFSILSFSSSERAVLLLHMQAVYTRARTHIAYWGVTIETKLLLNGVGMERA